MYKNKLTGEEFADKEKFVESLADCYRSMAIDRYNCDVKESIIIEALKELLETDKKRGSVTIKGVAHQFAVTLRQNVRYRKNPQGDLILEELLEKYGELLKPMLRVEIKESGQKVFKFLEREDLEPEEQMLAEQLEEYRIVTDGKPAIQLKDRTDDD